MTISKLTLASLAGAAVVAEAAQYGVSIDPVYGAAMAPRDACAQLPDLCTGAVMMQGLATTLTYLCPKTTEGPSTVHVTVTQTTTVTAIPGQSSGPEVPPKDAPTSNEPTTTTTIHSTQIMTKTITVSRKKDSSTSAPTPGHTTSTSIPNATTSQPVETKPLPNPDTSTIPTFTSDWLHPVGTTAHSVANNSTSIFIKPSVIIFTGAPGTAVGSHGASAKPSMRGNSTGYAFPTPHQLRDIDASTTVEPAKGGAGKISLGVEMVMVLGFVSAVVVHVAGFV